MAKGIFTRRAYDYDKGKLLESVLDYAIIQEEALDQVSSFVIDEHNRYQITSDHSTIVVEIKLEANKKVVNWRVRNDWCVFSEKDNIKLYQDNLDANSMDKERFEELNPEEKLESIRSTIKSSWINCNNLPKRGRGKARNRKGDFAVTLIPRLRNQIKVDLFSRNRLGDYT